MGLPDVIRQRLASRPSRREQGTCTRAAVLAALFVRSDETGPRVWLVRRPDTMRTHRGQVALPGGKWEPFDGDLQQTALREAHEEIGLTPACVDVLGSLDDHLTISGFLVTPFVGWVSDAFCPVPETAEVARVFSVPLDVFERPSDTMPHPSAPAGMRLPCYRYDGETIWGATLAMLHELAKKVRADEP